MRYLLVALLMMGCAVGPNYRTPKNDITSEWQTNEADTNPLIADWWKQFNDPLLTRYVEMAALHNNSLKAAEAHILEARGVRQMVASPLFPHLEADFNGARFHLGKNGPLQALASPGFPKREATESLYNFFFDASWELDLFGKTRRAMQREDAQIGALVAKKDDVLISIIAELVRNYVELRAFQRQIALNEANITLLEQKAEIVEKQMEVGYADQTAYDSVIIDLSFVRAALPLLKAEVMRNAYTISILTGSLPEALSAELKEEAPLPEIPEAIAVGLRSDLLRRRPDVREKERELAAATAEIGVATAAFFPSVTLYAIPGFQSTKIKDFFNASSGTWLLDGNVSMPLFQGGKLVGNLKAKKAAAEAALYRYQEIVLKALQEAESSLVAYTESLTTLSELTQSNDSTRAITDITQKQYEAGYASLLTLINSERQLNNSEGLLLDSHLFTLLKLVSLYKSLGGGWEFNPTGCLSTPASK